MKKFLFGIVALFLIASCSNNNAKEMDQEDSSSITDSIEESLKAQAEQARMDSIRMDSIQKEAEKAEFSKIQSLVKEFYETCVIGCNTKTSKSQVSKYLTNKLISKLIKMNEYEDGGVAVWNMRGDVQDCDERDKVLSVEESGENRVIVKFLDCGFTCKVRLDLVKENDAWKIDNFKFISQSNKSRYSERNQYN